MGGIAIVDLRGEGPFKRLVLLRLARDQKRYELALLFRFELRGFVLQLSQRHISVHYNRMLNLSPLPPCGVLRRGSRSKNRELQSANCGI